MFRQLKNRTPSFFIEIYFDLIKVRKLSDCVARRFRQKLYLQIQFNHYVTKFQ